MPLGFVATTPLRYCIVGISAVIVFFVQAINDFLVLCEYTCMLLHLLLILNLFIVFCRDLSFSAFDTATRDFPCIACHS